MNRSRMLQGLLSQPLKFPYPTDGLVSYWRLDEDPAIHNTVIEDSIGSNNGTLITNDGSTNKSVNGQIGEAINFDGTDDRVSLGDIGYVENYTVSAWVNASVFDDGYSHAVSKGGVFNNNTNYFLSVRRTSDVDRIGVGHRDGSTLHYRGVAPDINNFAGSWHMLSYTYDGNDFSIYQNGVLLTDRLEGANDTAPIPPSSGTTDETRIGGPINTTINNRFFNGIIDDVLLYNRALTQAEIQQIYNFGA